MAENLNHDELISQFVAAYGTSTADAQRYLAANQWDSASAASEYFTAMDEGTLDADEEGQEPQEAEPYTGPRTLDGRPAPESAAASTARSAPPKKKGGIATLSSLSQASSSGAHAGHAHADDDDDPDDPDFDPADEPRDLFAGGEKSALAVQDPANRNKSNAKKVVDDIIKKARANAKRPGADGGEPSSPAPPSRFRGGGQTVGGDGTPSQSFPGPTPRATAATESVTRILHLWEDGFSVEDGPLRRFDDPQHAADLQMIRSGRAPLHLMGVRPEQPVDVQLIKHDTDYKAPPKVYKPFGGQGNRLGSPTPGVSATIPANTTTAAAAPATATPQITPTYSVDSSQPIVNLRIQLADGSRLATRFNTTHTIGDVYAFIAASSANSNTRPWVLATTFPNKDHTDKGLVLGEMPEFKKGGTAVQKWA